MSGKNNQTLLNRFGKKKEREGKLFTSNIVEHR